MDLVELIKKRRSVREFTDKAIARESLEKIVDAAKFAPTARNVQPWEFVAVTDRQLLKRFRGNTEHGKFIAAAGACILVFSQDTKYFLEDCSAEPSPPCWRPRRWALLPAGWPGTKKTTPGNSISCWGPRIISSWSA